MKTPQELLESGEITFSEGAYYVAKRLTTLEDAAECWALFEKAKVFDSSLSWAFRSGMLDALKMARKEMAKLGPLHEKSLAILDRLSRFIQTAPRK